MKAPERIHVRWWNNGAASVHDEPATGSVEYERTASTLVPSIPPAPAPPHWTCDEGCGHDLLEHTIRHEGLSGFLECPNALELAAG